MEEDDIPDSIAFHTTQLLVISICVQVDTSPTTEKRQSAIYRAQATVVPELLLRLLFRAAQDRTQKGQELDALRITTELRLSQVPDLSNVLRHDHRAMSTDEDRLCVLCREGLPGLGSTGLQDERGALGTRLAEVRTGDFEVFALVVDFTDPVWFGVDAALAVQDDGIGAPGGFPEFVGYLDVFLCDGVAVVVLVRLVCVLC